MIAQQEIQYGFPAALLLALPFVPLECSSLNTASSMTQHLTSREDVQCDIHTMAVNHEPLSGCLTPWQSGARTPCGQEPSSPTGSACQGKLSTGYAGVPETAVIAGCVTFWLAREYRLGAHGKFVPGRWAGTGEQAFWSVPARGNLSVAEDVKWRHHIFQTRTLR